MDVPPFKPNTIGVYARCHSMLSTDIVTSPPGVTVHKNSLSPYGTSCREIRDIHGFNSEKLVRFLQSQLVGCSHETYSKRSFGFVDEWGEPIITEGACKTFQNSRWYRKMYYVEPEDERPSFPFQKATFLLIAYQDNILNLFTCTEQMIIDFFKQDTHVVRTMAQQFVERRQHNRNFVFTDDIFIMIDLLKIIYPEIDTVHFLDEGCNIFQSQKQTTKTKVTGEKVTGYHSLPLDEVPPKDPTIDYGGTKRYKKYKKSRRKLKRQK